MYLVGWIVVGVLTVSLHRRAVVSWRLPYDLTLSVVVKHVAVAIPFDRSVGTAYLICDGRAAQEDSCRNKKSNDFHDLLHSSNWLNDTSLETNCQLLGYVNSLSHRAYKISREDEAGAFARESVTGDEGEPRALCL